MQTVAGRAVRQSSLRQQNSALVLAEILAGSPSRARVAQRTGLTRATVSTLVDALIAGGLVTELPTVRSAGAGRPAAPLIPADSGPVGLGVQINVDYLGVRAVHLHGGTALESVAAVDVRRLGVPATVGRLAEMVTRSLDVLVNRDIDVAGCSVAVPGLVDPATGRLRIAPNLGWRDVDVAGGLPAVDGRRPTVVNEATLAAQAEAEVLRRNGQSDFLYVSGEIGIGGAVVTGGRLLTGGHGWGGEIGHTLVDPAGDRCGCGAIGCLETVAGAEAIAAAAGGGRTLDEIRLAAHVEEAGAVAALRRAGAALGIAVANAVNLLDLDLVVLGGCYAPLVDLLRPPMTGELRTRVITDSWAPVRVQAATVIDRAALTGAGRLALGGLLADPAGWVVGRRGDRPAG